MAQQKDDDTEKTHEPTPQKILEAREKGEVVRSADLVAAAGYFGVLLAGLSIGAASVGQAGSAMMVFLDQSGRLADLVFTGNGASALAGGAASIASALLGWYLIPAAVALLCVFAQRSLVFAGSKLQPKLSRLDPVQNAKNKYGPSGLFEFFKSFLKMVIFSVCLGVYLNHRLDDMAATLFGEPKLVGALMGQMLIEFMGVVAIVSLLIGCMDYIWQRHDFMRQHRMSQREVKEEHKRTEGDPHFKQERRQRGQRITADRMMADVPMADVIIVNPVHYAVALKWDRAAGSAPVCVAKGVDHMARAIRDCAAENGVPVRHDPPTARALHATTEIGQQIDPDHYRAVAAAIRFAEQMRRRARALR